MKNINKKQFNKKFPRLLCKRPSWTCIASMILALDLQSEVAALICAARRSTLCVSVRAIIIINIIIVHVFTSSRLLPFPCRTLENMRK